MRQLRIPIAGLMAGAAIFAVDAAVFRSMLAQGYYVRTSATTTFEVAGFALGVLPMASLLLFAALLRLPGLVIRGGSGSFFFGFEAFGLATLFGFIASCALLPSAVASYVNTVSSLLSPPLQPLLRHAPESFSEALEVTLVALVFSLPELLIALLGGWLPHRARIRVHIERCTSSSPHDSERPH